MTKTMMFTFNIIFLLFHINTPKAILKNELHLQRVYNV